MTIKEEINNLSVNADKKMNLSIVFACIILFIYCYFGSFSFFERTFSEINDLEFWKIIYHNAMAFVLFFGVGILFVKFILKQKLTYLSFNTKNKKFFLIVFLIALVVIPLLALSTTLDAEMITTYPLVNFKLYNEWWQILIYFVSYFLYYVGWEFLFRGIILHNIVDKCGILGAILITTIISALIHTSIGAFGKPMIETLSAIPAGLIFGYMAYKTDNIYLSLICHTLIGFLTDIFIFLII